jgi:hypothetical protein
LAHISIKHQVCVLQVWILRSGNEQPAHVDYSALRHLDLIKQIGMAVQHFEQFDQGQRRLCLAVLVAGEGIDAAAEDFGCKINEF